MVKQLRKSKKGSTLFLGNTILELMGLHEEGLVTLTLNHGCLVISPVNPSPVSDERFQACLDRVIAERGDVLKNLSD